MLRFAVITAYPDEDWHSLRIIDACAARGEVDVFGPTDFTVTTTEGSEAPGRPTVRVAGRDVRDWDVWLLPRALGSGGDVELQCDVYRLIGEMGVPLVNPIEGLLIAENKVLTSWLLCRAGVRTPATATAQTVADAMAALEALGDAVAKPPYGSLGKGIIRVAADDASARDRIAEMLRAHGVVYLQRYVGPASGRTAEDLRLFVVGDEVAGAILRVAPAGEFRTNIHQGGEARAADPEPSATELAVRATAALGLAYAGVDLLATDHGYTVLEVNGTPQWLGILRATGRDMAVAIVELAAARARPSRVEEASLRV